MASMCYLRILCYSVNLWNILEIRVCRRST
nr:MAG TPA: hypothetical protein [Caudoviricetes sp.]